MVEDQKAGIVSGGLAKTGDDIALVVIEIDQSAVGLDGFVLPQAVKPAAVGDAFGVVYRIAGKGIQLIGDVERDDALDIFGRRMTLADIQPIQRIVAGLSVGISGAADKIEDVSGSSASRSRRGVRY